MSSNVLVVNVGSGTVGCAVFDSTAVASGDPVWRATLVHHSDPATLHRIAESIEVTRELPGGIDELADAVVDDPSLTGHDRCDPSVLNSGADLDSIIAVVHRIVHGGPHLVEPTVIDAAVRERIDEAARWAPLHGAPALRMIDDFAERLPHATPVAVFDTAFHHTIPRWATAYGGPEAWLQRGLRRYGFHGISVEDAVQRIEQELSSTESDHRLVVVHLGGGCSVTAVRGGCSVDTTMGFTPNDGVLMAERSGSVDPGLLTYLMEVDGMQPCDLDELLNRRSGLAGLSGVAGDLGRVAEAAEGGNGQAQLAYRAYCHAVRKAIGSMAASAGGVDALVFTGSAIAGHPAVVTDVTDGLGFLGAAIHVVEVDEERAMAADAVALLESHQSADGKRPRMTDHGRVS